MIRFLGIFGLLKLKKLKLFSWLQKCRNWFIGEYISENQNINNQARAELLFNASALVFIILVPLSLFMFFTGVVGKIIPSVIGLVFVLCQLLLFKRFKNIWFSAFFLCSLTTLIVCININYNQTTNHLVEPFWMLVIVVFAVFMMGVRWGIYICLALLTGFSFFVVNHLQENLKVALESIPSTKYFIIIEIAAALLTLSYVLSMFVSTSRKSERALREGNKHLEKQNALVNKQNSEITILLKEIHHRVKNNLQVINSLLRLQSHQIKDEESRNVFDDAQYRIKAIALIHEQMYQSSDLSNIDSTNYFIGLSKNLLKQHLTNYSVDLVIDVKLPTWHQDFVVPLGLLLNELIANSIKHGNLVDQGVITIQLTAEGRTIALSYSDNGCGFLNEYEKGFGLELIETLCAQLNGEMDLVSECGKGVSYKFVFTTEPQDY